MIPSWNTYFLGSYWGDWAHSLYQLKFLYVPLLRSPKITILPKKMSVIFQEYSLRGKSPNMEFFWSANPRIWTEKRKIRPRKISVFGQFAQWFQGLTWRKSSPPPTKSVEFAEPNFHKCRIFMSLPPCKRIW